MQASQFIGKSRPSLTLLQFTLFALKNIFMCQHNLRWHISEFLFFINFLWLNCMCFACLLAINAFLIFNKCTSLSLLHFNLIIVLLLHDSWPCTAYAYILFVFNKFARVCVALMVWCSGLQLQAARFESWQQQFPFLFYLHFCNREDEQSQLYPCISAQRFINYLHKK